VVAEEKMNNPISREALSRARLSLQGAGAAVGWK
jgi:hypothetical protein